MPAEKIEDKIIKPVDLGQIESEKAKANKPKKVKPVILKDTAGNVVEEGDYFYSEEPGKGKAPIGFNEACGLPVDREDLIEVFNKVFNPKDGFLFFKTRDKEVYVVLVPLKNSISVSRENGSVEGDCQKHAMSFIVDGSVNLDTLKEKLKRINSPKFVKYTDR